jgi:hypothetical protein
LVRTTTNLHADSDSVNLPHNASQQTTAQGDPKRRDRGAPERSTDRARGPAPSRPPRKRRRDWRLERSEHRTRSRSGRMLCMGCSAGRRRNSRLIWSADDPVGSILRASITVITTSRAFGAPRQHGWAGRSIAGWQASLASPGRVGARVSTARQA